MDYTEPCPTCGKPVHRVVLLAHLVEAHGYPWPDGTPAALAEAARLQAHVAAENARLRARVADLEAGLLALLDPDPQTPSRSRLQASRLRVLERHAVQSNDELTRARGLLERVREQPGYQTDDDTIHCKHCAATWQPGDVPYHRAGCLWVAVGCWLGEG